MLSTVYSVTTTELHKPNSQKRQTFRTIFCLPPVRVLAFHLPVHIVLELLHVEQLEGLFELQEAVGQLEDVVADGVLLQRVLDVDRALAEPLDLEEIKD